MAVAAAGRVFGMVLTTLAVAVAVVSLALAVHYRIRCRRAGRAFEAVIGRLDRHDEALARAPAAYVSWDRSGEDEYHSGGLPRILGLHPTTAVSWEMLRGRLDPADGVMIEDAVAVLLQTGESFTAMARTADGERPLAPAGARVAEGMRRTEDRARAG